MGVTYNYLNLPQTVTVSGNIITYTYDATGRKWKKAVSNGATTLYDGGLQFSGNVLDFMQTAEGRARKTSATTYTYEYFLEDHLGNMRASFDNSGNSQPLQEEGYYPYGGTFNEYVPASPTKYTYQGKEYQDELNLNLYDFEARYYDPWKPYTTGQDAHAESYPLVSPYSWAMGNPMRFMDPTGMDPETEEQKRQRQYKEANDKEFESFQNSNGPSGMHSSEVGGTEAMAPSGYVSPNTRKSSSLGLTGSWNIEGVESPEAAETEQTPKGSYFSWAATSKPTEHQKNLYGTSDAIGEFFVAVMGGVLGGAPVQFGTRMAVTTAITTSEGFLFGSVGFRLPFSLRVGLYASQNTLKYGTFKWSTIAPRVLINTQWFGRRMLQIAPEFQPVLGQWSYQIIPKGTYIRLGLVGPQKGVGLGTWFQLYAPQGIKYIKY